MTTITDEYMYDMRKKAKSYTALFLKKGPNFEQDSEQKIIWEHGRRNHSLRVDGILPIVCPIMDGGEYAGIGVFNCSVEETIKIMEDDPAVKAGVLTFEAHSCRSFPGDMLPT